MHKLCSGSLLLFPVAILVALLCLYDPQGLKGSWPWLPELGVDFSLKLDALSLLFAGLISGIGILIQWYSMAYMRGKPSALLFRVYLTLFMLSMLGLVLSDNIILLFVFWELTTLTSYLLIGFNHEAEKSRKNALQAMLVTGTGGLALLAGLILLGEMAGSYQLSEILLLGDQLPQHALFTPSLILILLGALTKSAQFPFHFWLPAAMAAPTPVSAYLHSATMVKAGIYLLARVSPLYAQSELWMVALGIAGGITAVWSILVALRQTDLKLMLAHSTNTALGVLTFLLAFGTDYALAAALVFILAHAFYKAALFMVIGTIDKATGTREMAQLAGLKSVLPRSFLATLLASLSMAGVPITLGFLSKEYLYKAGLGIAWWAVAVLLVVNVLLVTMAFVLVIKPFLIRSNEQTVPVKPVEKGWPALGLWLPAMILAVLGLLVPILALPWLQTVVLDPATLAIQPAVVPVELKLWQGVNLPLMLSGITLLLGLAVYWVYPIVTKILNSTIGHCPAGADVYQWLLTTTLRVASWLAGLMQQRQLSRDVLLFFVVLMVLLLSRMSWTSLAELLPVFDTAEPLFYEIGLAGLLIAAAITSILTTSRLLAIAALSVVGFVITIVFMLYSAPDVAKTQLLVETLVIVFLALVMRHLPMLDTIASHSRARRLLHAVVALSIGLCVTMLLLQITRQPMDSLLTDFFAANSLPGGHGRNIVNVILVDFRALDTLGEILVVVVAALATLGLLNHLKKLKKTNKLPIQSPTGDAG